MYSIVCIVVNQKRVDLMIIMATTENSHANEFLSKIKY